MIGCLMVAEVVMQCFKQTQEYLRDTSDIGENGCWLNRNHKDSHGYAMKSHRYPNRNKERLHRVSVVAFTGSLPESDKNVLHKCDVRNCVNPDHLYVGTQAENVRDMMERGRNNPRMGTQINTNKLNPKQVLRIRNSPEPRSKLAAKYGVNVSTVRRIQIKEIWKHL